MLYVLKKIRLVPRFKLTTTLNVERAQVNERQATKQFHLKMMKLKIPDELFRIKLIQQERGIRYCGALF